MRISHDTWSTVLGVAYLGLLTNLLLLASALPLVVLLITTDPALSWPLLAAAAALATPGATAAFVAFREHGLGNGVVRPFVGALRSTWRKSLALGAGLAALLAVIAVDVRMLAPLDAGVVLVPVLAVLGVLAVATAMVALTAIAEAPTARLRDVLKASLYLGVRRWYLSALSIAVLGVQAGLFASMPAIAIGVTAAPALYLVWANARYTLRPVLETVEAPAS